MYPRHRPAVTILSVLILATITSLLFAGPLTPPTGPIAPTPGPEPRTAINSTNTPGDADSVFRISATGSYFLPANVLAGTGKSAIEIAASNVTIDLNGFTITSLSTLPSIRLSLTGRTNISIRNGNIGAIGGGGIDIAPNLVGATTEGGCVENVHVSGTSGVGIRVGNAVIVRNCTSSNNSDTGIKTGAGCTVTGCIATDNDQAGIDAGARNVVRDCVARSNAQAGIVASSGSTVQSCIASENQLHGIAMGSFSFVLSNTCVGNGASGTGAGIFTNSSASRIEGNTCSAAPTGVRVAGSDNFIAGNICSTNSLNWDIDSGNVCFVVQAAQSAGVLGNSGGVSPGSTNPNANYTY
ncbi:MAG: right-handed parallel beta-helix repeat-containing protein [Phycisphaerales bacterium]|nr:right-handed parallel beta-helix repeat-containing protein [Phycisphaerales bacterium]